MMEIIMMNKTYNVIVTKPITRLIMLIVIKIIYCNAKQKVKSFTESFTKQSKTLRDAKSHSIPLRGWSCVMLILPPTCPKDIWLGPRLGSSHVWDKNPSQALKKDRKNDGQLGRPVETNRWPHSYKS